MITHSSPWLNDDDHRAVAACLESRMLATGLLAEQFEAAIVRRIGGVEQCRSTPNGTDALRLALGMAGVRLGDEVVVPSYVCRDVADAVEACGAIVRLCDVGRDGTITPTTVARALSSRTRAIIAVHIFGNMCDVLGLKPLNITVIEDACQAFGASSAQGNAGTLGDLAVLSFHATKCLTTGEGGMVLRPRGSRSDWSDTAASPRLSDLAASLGLSQLARYDQFLARREEISRRYAQAFGTDKIRADPAQRGYRLRYMTKVKGDPAEWIDRCARRGVAVRRGVDALLHRQAGLADDAFPGACALFRSNLSIPFFPALTDAEVEGVVVTLLAVAEGFDGN